MKLRKQMVAGNWKMNGSVELVNQIANAISAVELDKVDVVVFPPYPLLNNALQNELVVGAQSVSEHEAGAYTGEIDAQLLAELGCKYTLVGHSERRSIYGESDEVVASKFQRAQCQGLIPVLCVGESEQEREQNLTESVVSRQIDAVINKLGVVSLVKSVIAYEPVWAIGTGKTATPEQAQQVHKFIRDKIASLDDAVSQSLILLYGGSVNEKNSELLFAQPDIDGGLVGGASLNPDSFVNICKSAQGNV
ncbi:triose-phosphate isomerase [Pseudoalteromonas tunicata]|jgi:triosephosphate isomerase|uniref:Triosephosphate isomerase n=1 Tax=Pseudoalteromonas tunicata D2 TaxID=87626 RepID=A4CD79_9GAMM|nr:triose-phosphate isomerase [Pseudoalteromonas tunicata]ATC94028.1 triosephosphate isomerase (TIM) [Pseudoalteromonas tunicata]AXT29811.1 triose-phosphate isomerase [Pseudoalteromonas tunicata]EAR27522.1 triosephosphate isomerase [Pseudoalteromonas tunicata D2]MDP4984018.1 triose-phosphate isomerase [Pseudoalteromonas tunicata]MDP5213761.1 triose-phosphate isomerase [Pseudoalteromonas tunicata]